MSAGVSAGGGRRRGALLHHVVLAGLLAALLIGAGATEPAFLAPRTQLALATQVVELALLSVPMTLILIAGGIDLSIGSIMALSAVALGLAFEAGASIWACVALALCVGGSAGGLNGLFITRTRTHPLIVTLATLSLFRGLAEGISLARPISGFPDAFLRWSQADLLGVPAPALICLGMLLAGWLALRQTVAGRYLFAIGHNETACRFSGVPVDRLRFWLYVLSGAAAGLAAVLFVARRNTAKADIGLGMELDVITAVVLGGTSVFGGRGSLLGTLLGVALLHEVRQYISWRWNNDELILVVVGALLIGAVLLNRALARREG